MPIDTFGPWCDAHRLPEPLLEHLFAPPRRWRFDYAWPIYMVALEVEGGAFVGGRHVRGAGFKRDLEKYNAAVLLGWRLVRVLHDQLHTIETVEMLRALIEQRRNST